MAAGPSDDEREALFEDRPTTGMGARFARLTALLHVAHQPAYATGPPQDAAGAAALGPPEATAFRVHDRFAQARAEAGLTTKDVAQLLGVSIWTVEQLESGRGDASRFLPLLAAATNKPVEWFQDASSPPGPGAAADANGANGRGPGDRWDARTPTHTEDPARSTEGATIVLVSIVLLVVVRFFTEVVPVLPRFANFVDIPIFALLGLAALTRAKAQERPTNRPIVLLSFGFVALCAISTIMNLSRVDIAPALVFVYGFLGPIAVYAAVHSLWPVGAAKRLSRLLVALCVLQLLIAFGIDLPLFLSEGNPDVISGTFGENPYQLVFFLLVVIGLLAGIFTFEKRRLAARVAPALLIAILAVIFLAQYRSLLLTTALTIVLLAFLLSAMGSRGLMIAAVTVASLLGTLAYLAETIPKLKFQDTISDANGDPTYYLKERLRTLDPVERLFGDNPRFALTGTGPGTYSSRAWRTFAQTSDSEADVAGGYVTALTHGRPYVTDVAEKYVLPQIRNAEVISGSFAITRPFASYLSLLAEVGPLGLLLIVAAYVWALFRSARMTLRSGRTARPGDPLPALCCASTVAFFILLQMGTLDNWLEVTRITFIAWIVFAVATKEYEAREQLHA